MTHPTGTGDRPFDPLVAALILRRRQLGITQRELTLRMRKTSFGDGPGVTYVESGRHVPTLATLRRIADALGCEIVLQPRDDGEAAS